MVYWARIVWQRTDYRTPFCFSSWSISIQIPTRRGRHHSFLANCQKVKDSILENDSDSNTVERPFGQPSIFILLFSLHQGSLPDNSPTVAQGLLHRCSTRAGRLLNGGCQYDSFVGLVRPSRSKLCHLDSALWALCKVNFVLYCLYSSFRWIPNGMNATPNRGRM